MRGGSSAENEHWRFISVQTKVAAYLALLRQTKTLPFCNHIFQYKSIQMPADNQSSESKIFDEYSSRQTGSYFGQILCVPCCCSRTCLTNYWTHYSRVNQTKAKRVDKLPANNISCGRSYLERPLSRPLKTPICAFEAEATPPGHAISIFITLQKRK